ncbi:MAG: HlyD family efflux transporter periplasmic adaptor subunit [Acidobacteria bacterium]|nr:HlyD family efflux transporter periplasmic adaptor subunit [Acidobacteriota bacterium]
MYRHAVTVVALCTLAVWIIVLGGCSSEHSGTVRFSGNLEVTDADVGFKISGRVLERAVSEGDLVTAGQPVARLEDADIRQEVAMRKAELQAARAYLDELEAGSRPEVIAQAEAAVQRAAAWLKELQTGSRPQEIASAEAAVASAAADFERIRQDFERQRALFQKDVISEREFQTYQSSYDMAQARLREAEERLSLIREGPRTEQVEQARAALREAEARQREIRNGPRAETIEQAQARLQQAREALQLSETRLSYTTIVSPLTGVVLTDNIEAGEIVAPGTPVVTVGDLHHVWLRGYVAETDLGRIKVGQAVRVTADTHPDKVYRGRVTFIASEAEFTPRSVQTTKERVKLVYRIKVDIPNPDLELKPGMPADGEIDTAGAGQ